jgi:hypothetical protein
MGPMRATLEVRSSMSRQANAQLKHPLQLEQLATNSQHCCCALGNVVVTRSLCAPDAAYLKDWTSSLNEYARTQPHGLAVIVLIDADAKPPGEAERTEIKNAYVAVRNSVRCAIQVVEGEGFAAAAKRSVMMIINLATGVGYPIRVTGTLTEATVLLKKLLGPAMNDDIDAAALSKVAEAIRHQLQH